LSKNINPKMDYDLLKRFYVNNDYTALRANGVTLIHGIPFTANQTYYIPGLFAYLHNPNVFNILENWILFTHGQPAAPPYLTALAESLGLSPWPAQLPAFEIKDIEFLATQDCWVRFGGTGNQPHFIPAGTWVAGPYVAYKQKCHIFFVERDTADGTLYARIEG
jgi:hypothetical protein